MMNYMLLKPLSSGALAGAIDYALISGNQRQSLGFAAAVATGTLVGEMISKRSIKDVNSSMNKFETRLVEVGTTSVAALGLDSIVFNTRSRARGQSTPARLGAIIASDIGSTYIKDMYSPNL